MTTCEASTRIHARPGSRIVLLGRPCGNTSAVLAVLQHAGIDVAAVILADSESSLQQGPVGQNECPVYRAPTPLATRRCLERLRPDLALAACFPWRLSRQARAAARRGVLNIHPSPLPHGRGPDPVFWVYRNGERDTGVTIHQMDEGLDTGPILAQQRIAAPDEMAAVTLERHLFEIGARMAARLAPQVLAGEAAYSPQDDLAASYQPAPAVHDWLMSSLLPAAWAWRFTQGVAPLHGPLAVQSGGKLIPVRRAIAWGEHGEPPDALPARAIPVRFSPGWVVFE